MLGERLRAARLMAGLSQEELAERTGVSKMAISKYEREIIKPSSGVLLRLGGALDRKVEYFLRPIQVKVQAPVHRERMGRSKRDREAVQARVEEWVERYLDIEVILGIASTFEMPDIERRVRSLDDAESIALKLRRAWGLGIGPIVDLTEILEEQGIKVGFVEGDVGFDALLFPLEDGSPVVAVRHDVPGDRLRFSLAHELGHLILEVEEPVDTEQACHRFAGAFLVPAPSARRELAIWGSKRPLGYLMMLKEKYGFSVQAWIHRARDLDIVSHTEYTRLWKRLGGRRRQELGERYPPEQPQRMERLVKVALMNDVISEARAAEILAIPVAQVKASMEVEPINAVAGAVCR
jgi:transcriptional regulator with XRE-family HTH domain